MSVEFKDYYATLGVARDASAADIKRAFRKLARQYHPDVAQDKMTAEGKFKEINEANEVLSDPEKRQEYDQLAANWRDTEGGFRPPPEAQRGAADRAFHFGGTGFSDFFEQYFSGGNHYGFQHEDGSFFGQDAARRADPPARHGNDIEGDILVSLGEALHGTVRPISLQMANHQTGQPEVRSFKVRIPPGATDGRRIRIPGHGEPGHGGAPPGDLYLRVRHAAHPDFTTRGADVFHELEIAPWDAVLGADIVVPTLSEPVKLRIPAGAANGQTLRVRGRGLPKGKSGEFGDFHVVLTVQLPAAISPEERDLWKRLRAASVTPPNSVA